MIWQQVLDSQVEEDKHGRGQGMQGMGGMQGVLQMVVEEPGIGENETGIESYEISPYGLHTMTKGGLTGYGLVYFMLAS